MKKLVITKRLALIAAILYCVDFVVGIVLMLCYPVYLQNTPRDIPTDFEALPLQISVMYLIYIAVQLLPFAAVAFWNYAQRQISRNKAMGTLIVTGVLYVVLGIAATLIYRGSINIAVLYGLGVFKSYQMTSSTHRMFSPLRTVGLVLLCCAAAVELYAVTHQEGDRYEINSYAPQGQGSDRPDGDTENY